MRTVSQGAVEFFSKREDVIHLHIDGQIIVRNRGLRLKETLRNHLRKIRRETGSSKNNRKRWKDGVTPKA